MTELPLARRARGRSAWLAVSSALALTLAACQDTASTEASVQAPNTSVARNARSSNAHIPDEYIVVFNDDVTDAGGRTNALAKSNGAAVRFTYSNTIKGFSAHMSAQAAEAILNDPNVAYVEPDQDISAAGVASSGVESPSPWGLDRIDQRSASLDQSYSWSSDGGGVTIYILDTGILTSHVDFGGRASYGPDYIGGGSSTDCNGHGTHMAGSAAGAHFGVAKGADVVSVRVLDCNGAGSASAAIAGLDWVAANHTGPSVANLSFAGPFSAALNQSVANAIAQGVTVTAAAGDYGIPWDACQYSPASAPGSITVGAARQPTSTTDAVAGMSNQGACIDLFAPGYMIISDWYTNNTVNYTLDGSSSAAAFTAGAAAIYLSAHPGATPADVANALIGNATMGALTGLVGGSPNRLLYTGNGSQPPPPPPPSNSAPVANFSASCSKASCTFNASSSTDDAGILNYSWTFGDGSSYSSAGPTASHAYRGKGTFTEVVTLTVRDAGGLSGQAQKTLTIKTTGK